MPQLPVTLPCNPAQGDLPVRFDTDVETVLPDFADPTQPVTNTVVEGVTSLQKGWQELSAYAAAQSDPTRATDTYLDVKAEDRGSHRQPGELDTALRARVFSIPSTVTPLAILDVVNTILAPYTSIQAEYVDCILDGLFLSDDTGVWHSFLGNVDQDYPDRLYGIRQQAHPGQSFLTPDSNGRNFTLRVPVLSGLTITGAFCYDFPAVSGVDGTDQGAYLTAGPSIYIPSFAYLSDYGTTALQVYQAIADAVSAIRGMGVRWFLLADPLLV